MHELINSGQVVVDYAPTLIRFGDGFITCVLPSKFIETRKMKSMDLTS